MWQIITGGLSSLITGVLTPWFSYLNKKQDTTLDGFKVATGSDEKGYEAWLAYRAQVDSAHMAETAWWGPKLCLMIIALPTAIHVGLVEADSWTATGVPLIGHIGVLKLPPDYFAFEQRVVEWLFGAAVAGPAISAATAWLHRK